jgi:hypothetical protein
MNELEKGFVLGFFVGDGHFGGDGKQAQITLRRHVKHRKLLDRLMEFLPGSVSYGPYSHGSREYYQWMLRGPALKKLVDSKLLNQLVDFDDDAANRYGLMVEKYF